MIKGEVEVWILSGSGTGQVGFPVFSPVPSSQPVSNCVFDQYMLTGIFNLCLSVPCLFDSITSYIQFCFLLSWHYVYLPQLCSSYVSSSSSLITLLCVYVVCLSRKVDSVHLDVRLREENQPFGIRFYSYEIYLEPLLLITLFILTCYKTALASRTLLLKSLTDISEFI